MGKRRKILIAVIGLMALVLAALALVPLLFKDQLEERIQEELGTEIDAHISWSNVGISLFRSFPNLAFRLDDLAVTGVREFEGDTLLSVPRFRLVLELGSVLRSLVGDEPIVLRAVQLRDPAVQLLVLEDGKANWGSITDAGEKWAERDSPASIAFSLRRLQLSGGSIAYRNQQADINASLSELDLSLSGDFRKTRFMINSSTYADAVSVEMAGITYLDRVRLQVDAAVDADMEAQRFALRDNVVRLNDLVLEAAGTVGLEDEAFSIDLEFGAPGNAFREILSLVPAVYASDFPDLRTSGSMRANGWARGDYGPDDFPAMNLEIAVEDGSVQYPEQPLAARDILVDLAITNPGGHMDSTEVNLNRFSMLLGQEQLTASAAVRTPVSDPEIQASLNGRVDLADLFRTFRLEDVHELAGFVTANAEILARLSDIEAERFERIKADGQLHIAGLVLDATDLPQILRVNEAALQLSPSYAELISLRGSLGNSDFIASGRLDNLLGFAMRNEVLRGQAHLTSRHVALDELKSDHELEIIPIPPQIHLDLDAVIRQMSFGPLEMSNGQGRLQIRDQHANLENFRLEVLGGTVTATGHYETRDPARPGFDFDLRLADLDVPTAFSSIETVRAFAPVAEYAHGRVSGQLRLDGILGSNMMPVYDALSGRGTLRTSGLRVEGFPALHRLADVLRLSQLRNPALSDLNTAIEIRDGRVHVAPFDVRIGQLNMNVAGWNAIDQTLQYTLALELPRAALGTEADRVITDLAARLGRAADVQAAETITVGVQLTGSITNPEISTDLVDTTRGAVVETLRRDAEQLVEEQIDTVAEAVRRRAEEEARRIVAAAEESATVIRQEARSLAETVRREAYQQADALVARASGAIARAAAERAADQIRREADQRADQIIKEADARAESLVAEARRRADSIPDGIP